MSTAVGRDEDGLAFSLVRGAPLYRLERTLGLLSEDDLRIGRRLVVILAVVWVPVVALAALDRQLMEGTVADPLLRHFGVHARCLVAIPLFLVGEAMVERYLPVLIRQFAVAGLVDRDVLPRFREVLRRTAALRDSWWGLALILALVVAGMGYAAAQALSIHEVSWAIVDSEGRPSVGLAGRWYLFVTRPVFVFMWIQWLWWVLIVAILFRRIVGLGLHLVPTHPDQAAGLGFLENVPIAFTPVVFGLAAVSAATHGHEVLYHGTHVDTLYLPMGILVAILVVIFLSPLLLFSGELQRLKRRSLLAYGALVGRHGQLVERRWIRGERLEDPLLEAPEIGPVADAITMYDAVARIRPTPFRKGPVIALAAAAMLPMVPVLAIEVPLREVLLKVLKSLL